MVQNQIAFVDSIKYLDGYPVIETYNLGGAGVAAIIKCETQADVDAINYDAFENYDENLAIDLLFEDASIVAESIARLGDVRALHDTPTEHGDGDGVTVVVMDSGIDTTHDVFGPDQIVERKDVVGGEGDDTVGHGTACAGQIARLAPACELIDLRIFGGKGRTSLKVIVKAYSWLINNTDKYDVVNMSWGAQKRVRKLDKLQDRLVTNGVRDVTAAGNTGGKGGSPATADKAFSAGACDVSGRMADFSSYNPDHGNPEVAAIGVAVRLARADGTSMGNPLDDEWTVASGTSFAAPHTAGMVAKYLSEKPDASPKKIYDAFVSTADDIPNVPEDGHGLAKYMAALEDSPKEGSPETADANVWQFIGNDTIWIRADWLTNGKYTVRKDKLLEAFEKK